jgi:hypothetical protein
VKKTSPARPSGTRIKPTPGKARARQAAAAHPTTRRNGNEATTSLANERMVAASESGQPSNAAVSPAEINRRNRTYWRQESERIAGLLQNHDISQIMHEREKRKADYVRLAISEADRLERVRHQRSLEEDVAALADELGSLRINKAQRARAKAPRSVTDDGSTIPDIIRALVGRVDFRDLPPKQLWPHFFAELDACGLDPEDVAMPRDPLRSGYVYSSMRGRKQIGFSRFRRLVSEARKKMWRKPG